MGGGRNTGHRPADPRRHSLGDVGIVALCIDGYGIGGTLNTTGHHLGDSHVAIALGGQDRGDTGGGGHGGR